MLRYVCGFDIQACDLRLVKNVFFTEKVLSTDHLKLPF